jgi:acetyl-CoA carboxylase alpha subunit
MLRSSFAFNDASAGSPWETGPEPTLIVTGQQTVLEWGRVGSGTASKRGFAAMTDDDWRTPLLEAIRPAADAEPEEPPVNRLGWPDYTPRNAVRWGRASIGGVETVLAAWDFNVYGGSFGERDASAFLAAVDTAVKARRPLVSLIRSGGTRLQEGVAGLVGMPRATLAVRRLARAGLPHIVVADQPTTGGVWVTIASRADIRAAIAGAVVGFAGPRVVEAVTGSTPGPGSHTAESAYAAGLVDVVLEPGDAADWLGRVLGVLDSTAIRHVEGVPAPPLPERDGAEQVRAARSGSRPNGGDLLAGLVVEPVPLVGNDDSVAAAMGRLDATGQPVVAVAIAARRGGRPTPAGYRLLTRAARLADRAELPLLTLIDLPTAAPEAEAENAGQAAAIGEAMDAVLSCRAATIAVLTGEGGSGGAMAAACCDSLLMCPSSYFAALGPEGAAVTLRRSPDEAARLMGVRPADLLALGVADGVIPDSDSPDFAVAVAAEVGRQARAEPARRLDARERRWSFPVSGALSHDGA